MIRGPAALSRFLRVSKPTPPAYEPSQMTNRAAILLLTLLAPLSATAEQPIEFIAGLTSTYDSNVPRLPGSADPSPIPGIAKTSDTINQANVGVKAQLPVGLQRFIFGADASRYFYRQFTGLDHTDTHAALDWQWRVGHPFRGALSHTCDNQQTSFAYNQGGPPDTRRLNSTRFQIEVTPAPDWRTTLELGYSEENHALDNMQVYDRDTLRASAELRYETPLGNALGSRVRQGHHHLPTPQLIGSALIDNSYRNTALTAFYQGQLTAVSAIGLEVGYESISHDKLASRDFAGWTGRSSYRWTTPITRVITQAWRSVDTVSNEAASYVIEKGVSIESRWAVTLKISTEMKLLRQWRQRAGDSSGTEELRRDTANLGRIAVNYDATDKIRLAFAFDAEQRKSNVASAEFDDRQFSLQLRVSL